MSEGNEKSISYQEMYENEKKNYEGEQVKVVEITGINEALAKEIYSLQRCVINLSKMIPNIKN